MEQHGRLGQLLGAAERLRSFGKALRADRHRPVRAKPAGIERGFDLSCQRDRHVEPIIEPGERVRPGLDVDMQVGVARPQLRQARHQLVGGEERENRQLEAHERALAVRPLDGEPERI
jgi:hypothetical protein